MLRALPLGVLLSHWYAIQGLHLRVRPFEASGFPSLSTFPPPSHQAPLLVRSSSILQSQPGTFSRRGPLDHLSDRSLSELEQRRI